MNSYPAASVLLSVCNKKTGLQNEISGRNNEGKLHEKYPSEILIIPGSGHWPEC